MNGRKKTQTNTIYEPELAMNKNKQQQKKNEQKKKKKNIEHRIQTFNK